jgi:taurine dioxygenase
MDSAIEGAITVTPLSKTLGARIEGVDVSAPLDAATFAAIYRAYLDWHVIAIPGQALTPEQVVAFSRRFGPVEPHVKTAFHHPETPLVLVLSNRIIDGKPLGARDGGTFWHSDVSYRAKPARATMLYAVEVPQEHGDTLFANMTQAHEEMAPDLKRRLEGLQAVHDYSKADEISAARGARRAPLTAAEKKAVPPVAHPLVRTHPETGRKAIYATPAYGRRILEVSDDESEALMETLFDHCLRDRYRLRYRWRVGDVVVWDNAAVMHSATALDEPPVGHRTIWRTIISGEAPV